MTEDPMLKRLARKLDDESLLFTKFANYASGDVALEFVAPEIRKATEDRLQTLHVPWPRLVIGAIEERLTITGFRGSRDEPANAELWDIWQDNNLDELSILAHVEALTYGRAFALVWADDTGKPTITVESARQCAVLFDPASRKVVAGLKRWVADGRGQAVVFTPTVIRRFTTNSDVIEGGNNTPGSLEGATWDLSADVIPNPLGMVPLVPLVNRPSISKPDGISELADLIPTFDALTKLSSDLMVSSEFLASPRRWATGLTLEEERDDNDVPTGDIDEGNNFSDLPGRLWMAEDPQARFGQFDAADLSGFVNSLSMLKRDLSSVASLPPTYVGQFGDVPSSADAIRSAESSLVATARRKAMTFGGAWETVMRIAHAIEVGYWSPDLQRLEVMWANFETRTMAQAMDAATKGVQSEILDPDFAAEKFLDMSPTEIERNAEARRRRGIEDVARQAIAG